MIQKIAMQSIWGGAGVYPELGMLIATIRVLLEKSGLMPGRCAMRSEAGAKIGQKQRLFFNAVLMLNLEGLMLPGRSECSSGDGMGGQPQFSEK